MGNWAAIDDNLNLRCFDQKRRFGLIDLYRLQRYVDGLWETRPQSKRAACPDPIFTGSPPRDKSLVFLAGIIGVPWQDVATTDNSFAQGAPLKYLTYQEMLNQNRWDMILGNPGDATTPPTPPGDKLMFETSKDCTTLFPGAAHPLIDAPLAASGAGQPGAPSAINGREVVSRTEAGDLSTPASSSCRPPCKDCAAGAAACDCKTTDAAFMRPLCMGTTSSTPKLSWPPRVARSEGLRGEGHRELDRRFDLSENPRERE